MKIRVEKPNVENLETLRQQLITVQDNINSVLNNVGFDYAQRLSFKFYPSQLPMLLATPALPRPAWGLHGVYLRNLTTDSVTPMYGIFLDWIADAGGIRIRGISGLTSGNLYEIRLIAYA